jgi:hypothetical protein
MSYMTCHVSAPVAPGFLAVAALWRMAATAARCRVSSFSQTTNDLLRLPAPAGCITQYLMTQSQRMWKVRTKRNTQHCVCYMQTLTQPGAHPQHTNANAWQLVCTVGRVSMYRMPRLHHTSIYCCRRAAMLMRRRTVLTVSPVHRRHSSSQRRASASSSSPGGSVDLNTAAAAHSSHTACNNSPQIHATSSCSQSRLYCK